MAAKVVVAAGLIVFRRITSKVEYLLLKASYGDFHWSPPKGASFSAISTLYCQKSILTT